MRGNDAELHTVSPKDFVSIISGIKGEPLAQNDLCDSFIGIKGTTT
jgi:hypothetical protein